MKVYVLAGSVLTAGLISALVAQQSGRDTDQAGHTGQYGGQTGQTDQITKRPGAGRGEENLANMNPTQRFLHMSYQNNLLEIQLSKMVADKANQDDIKQFARTLAQDHQRANQQLQQVAQRKNIQLPQDVNEWQQAKLQHASRMPTEDLARNYVFHQVGLHETEILKYRWAANHIEDQDVKVLATRMVPTLQTHLRHAERLSQQLVGGQGTVTER